ncbi:MAG: hypothetical protein FWG74_06930, partial [Planctomycetes bacterium]|nr:hypothetical protein [Planctomycetota bacterium]
MTQSQGPAIRRVPPANRRQLLLAAALAFFAIWQATAEVRAGEPEFLPVVLLTRDIGDPRAPGNIKLACILPENIAQR